MTLATSQIVNVTVNLSPVAAQSQNLNTLLVLDDDPTGTIGTVERYRVYNTFEDVAQDFGAGHSYTLSALAYFSQVPKPREIMLGLWAKTAKPGYLYSGTFSASEEQALAATLSGQNDVDGWSMRLELVGGTAFDVESFSFGSGLSFEGIAAVLDSEISPDFSCRFDKNLMRFVFSTTDTGTDAGFILPPTELTGAGIGVDVSNVLKIRTPAQGARVSRGIAAETAFNALTTFADSFGQLWYGVFLPSATETDILEEAAPFIEATETKHLLFVNTQEPDTLVNFDDPGVQN